MNNKYYFVFILLLSSICSQYAIAGQLDNNLNVGISLQDFSYTEFGDTDIVLNREDGLLPGFILGAGVHWDNFSGVLRGEIFNGLVDYNGQTQSGIPLKAKTDEKITRVEATLHFNLKPFNQYNMSVLAGIGYREWRRDINATRITLSLLEIYRWKYWTLGTSVTFFKKGKRSAGVNVRLLRPIKPTLDVKFPGFDEVTLDLGVNDSARLELFYHFVLRNNQQWTISPYWEYWYMGRSPNKGLTINGVSTVNVAWEPRSDTKIFGVLLSERFEP